MNNTNIVQVNGENGSTNKEQARKHAGRQAFHLWDRRRLLLDVNIQQLRYSILLLIKGFGELIAVVEEELAIVDRDGLPHDQVAIGYKATRLQVAGSGGDRHERALGGVDFGQLASLQHQRESVAARVGLVHLIGSTSEREEREKKERKRHSQGSETCPFFLSFFLHFIDRV